MPWWRDSFVNSIWSTIQQQHSDIEQVDLFMLLICCYNTFIMGNILNSHTLDIALRLFVALTLGMIIGIERVWAHKTAGMRTYALVAMGSALFIIISETLAMKYLNVGGFDASRIASQIIVGVGFLGAGSIMLQGNRISGLTTASGFWVTAGIGMAVGFGLFDLAFITTILTLFVFTVLWFVEEKLKKSKYFNDQNNPQE
jgi:putative Mg2+ transporter-C (MgtC) family protein